MADYNIPDMDQARRAVDLAVNATDRARVAGLQFAAGLSADIAATEAASLARIRFKKGPEAAKAAKPRTEANASVYYRNAETLAREAKAGAKAIEEQTRPRKPSGKPPLEVEVAVAEAAAKPVAGNKVVLVRAGRDIAVAEPGADGVARFRIDASDIETAPSSGIRMAAFRAPGQGTGIPPELTAELRTDTGELVARRPLGRDIASGKITADLKPLRPTKGGGGKGM